MGFGGSQCPPALWCEMKRAQTNTSFRLSKVGELHLLVNISLKYKRSVQLEGLYYLYNTKLKGTVPKWRRCGLH